MKSIFWIVILAAFAAALLAVNPMVDAAPLTQQDATPTAKPTRKNGGQPAKAKTPKPKGAPNKTPIPTLQAVSPEFEDADDGSAAPLAAAASGPMTSRILVFNPDPSGSATVQIDIYNAGGMVEHTSTVNVSKNGAKLVTLPASLGSSFQGGAVVSSDKNVQAIVVGANKKNTARDAYEGTAAPATDVTLPFVRHLAQNTQNTLLAIQNTSPNAAKVTVTFYNPNGSVANTQNANLAGHQPLYLNTNTLFPTGTFVGSARVTANQNVAVAAQTLYYLDTAAFDGESAADQDTLLFLSQAQRKLNRAGVAQNWSELYVRNNGVNPTTITVEFYSSAGALVHTETVNNVPAQGLAQFALQDGAFAALGNSYNGWAKVSSSGEAIVASALAVYAKGKRMYSVNLLPNAATALRYVCGDTSRTGDQITRLNILNLGSKKAKIQVVLYKGDSGAKTATAKMSIPANNMATVLLSDPAFNNAGTNYQGMAIVRSKGTAAPKLVVTANNPFGSSKLTGTTGYQCSALP